MTTPVPWVLITYVVVIGAAIIIIVGATTRNRRRDDAEIWLQQRKLVVCTAVEGMGTDDPVRVWWVGTIEDTMVCMDGQAPTSVVNARRRYPCTHRGPLAAVRMARKHDLLSSYPVPPTRWPRLYGRTGPHK